MIVVVIYPDSFLMQVKTEEDFKSPKQLVDSVLARLVKVDGMALKVFDPETGEGIEIGCYKYFDRKLEVIKG